MEQGQHREGHAVKARLYLGIVATALSLSACRHEQPSVDPRVERIWNGHENVLVSALATRKYLESDLLAAVAFFEKTTALNSPRGLDEVGLVVVPTDELNKDLARWRAWYADNKTRLCLDSATGEVRLAPTPRKAGDSDCPNRPVP
jgi:hypothetical protein